MLKVQRILSTSMCICHLVLGISVLFHVGPIGTSPAWGVLSEIWTEYGPPTLFLFISAFAGVGFFVRQSLQLSLYLGAVLMLIWTSGLALVWRVSGEPQPSIVFLINIAIMKSCVAYFWLAYERQTAAIDQLSHELAETIHQSQRGRDAGDLGED